MVRQTKSTSTAAPVVAPVVAPVAVSVAVTEEKKPKKTKAASDTAPVVEAPVVSTPVVEAPAVEAAAPDALSSKLNDFGSKIAQIASLLTTMKSDYKAL